MLNECMDKLGFYFCPSFQFLCLAAKRFCNTGVHRKAD